MTLLATSLATPKNAVALIMTPAPRDPWHTERLLVLDRINATRAAHGLAPLVHLDLLAKIGDQHCRDLLEDQVTGHFSRRGTPPYLRYLLAGGTGYHRQNAAGFITSAPLAPHVISQALLASVDRMLAEQPPADGHRTTLLDPVSTHIGVGIAARGGWLVSTHEVAVLLAKDVSLPPPVARPRTELRYAASLPAPWEVRAVEVLWEPLPSPLSTAQANAITSYRYPPRRAITFLHSDSTAAARLSPKRPASGHLIETSRGRFSYDWATGPEPGAELLVVWAARGPRQRELVAVAAAAVVVTADGTVPPELGRWLELRAVGQPPRRDD